MSHIKTLLMLISSKVTWFQQICLQLKIENTLYKPPTKFFFFFILQTSFLKLFPGLTSWPSGAQQIICCHSNKGENLRLTSGIPVLGYVKSVKISQI